MAYVPPVGIPDPPSFIDAAAPDPPASWSAGTPSATAGYYYIDRTHGSATDSGNANGHPGLPRLTVPTSLAAGSYVEIHGTGYTLQGSWTLNGADGNRVYVKGVGDPTFTGTAGLTEIRGSHWTVEGIHWVDARIRVGSSTTPATQFCLRDFEISGYSGIGTSSMVGGAVLGCNNGVFYQGYIHDNGPLTDDHGDIDNHAFGPGGMNNVWILDCTMERNQGDGVQINAGSADNQPSTHHIYVGDCVSDANWQCGFWAKQCEDVIFSSCIARNHVASPSGFGAGAGFGGQYYPSRVWFINCISHDNDIGFRIASGVRSPTSDSSSGTGEEVYFIGCLVYNCATAGGYSVSNNQSPAAFSLWDLNDRWIVNCTIWNCGGGIRNRPNGGGEAWRCHIVNTIIGAHTVTNDREIWCPSSGFDEAGSLMQNNVVIGDRISWNEDTVRTLAGFQTQHSTGANCTSSSPSFVNSGSGDFRLQSGDTAAQGQGTEPDVFATFTSLYSLDIAADILGVSRPQGAAWDIGAYEFEAGVDTPVYGGHPVMAVLF